MTADTEPGTRDRLVAAAVSELEEHGHAAISLRAVARRTGISHAAPKHHFASRADLLTAVATQGFQGLTAELAAVAAEDPSQRLARLGTAYVDFGLSHAAVFDLMFRPEHLVVDDPALREAQAASVQRLTEAATALAGRRGVPAATLTLMAWALVHGLVTLVRQGALAGPAPLSDSQVAETHAVVEAFARLLAPAP